MPPRVESPLSRRACAGRLSRRSRPLAQDLEKSLSKVKAAQVDGRNVAEIVKAAEGCGLIVNCLPPFFNRRVMDAALEVRACYQDLAVGSENEDDDFVDAMRAEFARDQEFKDAGISALTNTGSAPGFANVVAREAVDKFDSVDSIDFVELRSLTPVSTLPNPTLY